MRLPISTCRGLSQRLRRISYHLTPCENALSKSLPPKLKPQKHQCVVCGEKFSNYPIPPHRRNDTGQECIGFRSTPML